MAGSNKPKLVAPKKPCGSCPYRQDVPSGIWAEDNYTKLPAYDNALPAQPQSLFLCHQRDGNLCAGWLATHGPQELLAIRLGIEMYETVDPAVYNYTTDVPVFASGKEACAHGVRDILNPGERAKKMAEGLMKILPDEGDPIE